MSTQQSPLKKYRNIQGGKGNIPHLVSSASGTHRTLTAAINRWNSHCWAQSTNPMLVPGHWQDLAIQYRTEAENLKTCQPRSPAYAIAHCWHQIRTGKRTQRERAKEHLLLVTPLKHNPHDTMWGHANRLVYPFPFCLICYYSKKETAVT